MNFSDHYINYRMADRRISLARAVEVVNNPVRREVQEDGRTRYWGYVETIGHFIRVVVETDGETIVTTFIDGEFKP